jgi:hypothetical protein
MCQCTGATQRAIFVRMPGERSDRCIPLSVVHDDSEVYESGHAGNLVVASLVGREGGTRVIFAELSSLRPSASPCFGTLALGVLRDGPRCFWLSSLGGE